MIYHRVLLPKLPSTFIEMEEANERYSQSDGQW